jgi:anti-sigma factor RsiW
MNQDFQLKLQAYLDGELAERETREVEAALAGDAEARALLTELRNTAGALAEFEAGLKLPETREFFWSKIQREIQRQDQAAAGLPTPVPFWRRLLIPAGAFAALVVVGLIGFKLLAPVNDAQAAAVETFLTDAGAMTYRDEAEGMTVVWLSYPAENEFADFE